MLATPIKFSADDKMVSFLLENKHYFFPFSISVLFKRFNVSPAIAMVLRADFVSGVAPSQKIHCNIAIRGTIVHGLPLIFLLKIDFFCSTS